MEFITSKYFNTFTAAYHLAGIDDDYAMPHSHSGTCEIILSMTEGGHVIIKNRIFPLTKKGLYFIHGLDVHHPAPEDNDNYLRSRLVISMRFLKKIIELMDMQVAYERLFTAEGGMYCLLSDEDFERADGYFKTACESYSGDKENDFKTADAIMAITELFKLGYNYVESPDVNANVAVDTALKYIDTHISQNITIEDISASCNLNKFYMCHLFKVVVGMNISHYIRLKRVAIAKKALSDTNKSISEISAETGFNSVSYFGRVFLELEGVTPTEYRKIIRN